MDKKEKDFATYKEFGKMLREVANLCAKYGNTSLYGTQRKGVLRGQSRRIRYLYRTMDERLF